MREHTSRHRAGSIIEPEKLEAEIWRIVGETAADLTAEAAGTSLEYDDLLGEGLARVVAALATGKAEPVRTHIARHARLAMKDAIRRERRVADRVE